MASFWYNKSVYKVGDNTLDLNNDSFKVMLSTSTHVPNKDDEFVDDGGSDDAIDGEITATNYTGGFGGAGRLALTTSWSEDLTNDRAVFDAANVTWSSLGGASNSTIEHATVIKEVTNDAASPVLVELDTATLTTNGTDVTLEFHADGIGYAQQ